MSFRSEGSQVGDVDHEVDVVVIGGGPAGCWAALTAAEAGARVLLAEKGYVGTGGATAAGNTTVIHAAPESAGRKGAIERRVARGRGFVDPFLVERIVDEGWRGLNRIADQGYGFPILADGQSYRGSLRGADYLRFMRKLLVRAGVIIRDQSPALELLTAEGAVAGVIGFDRVARRHWRARAGAVVIASGGCAFLSGALGTNNLTGDGYLMAAEAGAALTAMEFSGQYGIAPVWTSVTKGIVYFWGSFFDAAGRPIEPANDRQETVARHLCEGPVSVVLDRVPPYVQEGMRRGQPNIFVPFDRRGINPFTDRFPVTLRFEGTVRGTGGLATDAEAATSVPGLYAAGDAASRDKLAGATSGGGGPNATWAIATGTWAGRAASRFAKSHGARHATRRATALGGVGTGQAGADAGFVREARARVQGEILPLDKSFYRTGAGLVASTVALDTLWTDLRDRLAPDPTEAHRAREVAAMAATARWIVAAASARQESRGIHRRNDLPETDPAPPRRLFTGGTDRVWVESETAHKEAVGA